MAAFRVFFRRGLRSRITLGVVAVALVVLGGGALLSYANVSRFFRAAVDQALQARFDGYSRLVDSFVDGMEENSRDVASVVATLFEAGVDPRKAADDLEDYLADRATRVTGALGTGIWIEPSALGGARFGPYAYRDGAGAIVTREYEFEEYAYETHPWYRISADDPRAGVVRITEPYPDRLGDEIVMFVTFSCPILGPGGNFLGVTSTDWNPAYLAEALSPLKPTPGSFSAFVDTRSGKVLYSTEPKLLMTDLRDDAFLTATLAGESIAGRGAFVHRDERGFALVLAVPEAEAYAEERSAMAVYLAIALAILFAVAASMLLFLDRAVISPLSRVLDAVQAIAGGNYARKVDAKGDDEIARIGRSVDALAWEILGRERALRESADFLDGLFENAPEALIAVDPSFVVTKANAAAASLFGVSDATGRGLFDAYPALAGYADEMIRALDSGSPFRVPRTRLSTDETRAASIVAAPMRSRSGEGSGPGALILVSDLEELERAEERLRQVQRMETVGTLAGGLAHDFNNILGSILGTASLLRLEISSGNPPDAKRVDEAMATVEDASQRAAAVVRQLLTFARGGGERVFRRSSVAEIVAAVARLGEATFDNSVTVDMGGIPSGLRVDVDRNEIVQALLNVCINACHAMTIMREPDEPQGGTLSISAREVVADMAFLGEEPGATPGGTYVELAVSDTGVGMDQATLARVFDPFFTTKPQGIGNGLGMSMVYSTVRHNGGFVRVESRKGEGTTVRVYLPCRGDGDAEGFALPAEEGRLAGDCLVVEDDDAIRATVTAMLSASGARAIPASRGSDAVQLIRGEASAVRFAVVDMAMPGMSGLVTMRALREERADLPILIMSGYRHDERVGQAMDSGADGFLQKPFTVSALVAAVREAIKAAERRRKS